MLASYNGSHNESPEFADCLAGFENDIDKTDTVMLVAIIV